MTTIRQVWLAGVVLGLVTLFGAEVGWAACCRCFPCAEAGIACLTGPQTEADCIAHCPTGGSAVCGFQDFSVDATCGQGVFRDCTEINSVPVGAPAPAANSLALAAMAIGLLVVGAAVTARRSR